MARPVTKRFKVQAVVSDLFYTLVDPDVHRPEGFTRARKIAEVLGLSDGDRFVGWWRQMEALRHVDGTKKVVEYAREYALEQEGLTCTAQQLEEVSQIWGRMHDRALLEPEAGVLSALRNLRERGVKLGLLSNIDEREAVCWPRSPLSPLFDTACLSCVIGQSKPSKEAYSTVLSMLGESASSSIYVGDGSHDELRGARDAGFGLVVFMKGFIARSQNRDERAIASREETADAVIMDLNELGTIVDHLRPKATA
jgi:FMN phosphatase YigB (HAD superfamily)